VHRKLHR